MKRTRTTRRRPATPRPARPKPLTVRRPTLVGTRIPRLEGRDKVTGAARYVDDLRVDGVLHGFTVRSTIPYGRIKRIERDPAFDWSGVVVADHRDIPGANAVTLIEADQPLLAYDLVRHADEPILLVAHEDRERAQAAALAFRIEYEPLEPVLTVEDSLAKKALLYGDDNVFKEIRIERGDVASVLSRAATTSSSRASTALATRSSSTSRTTA
jgi:CO/xanthine dehydrogenase Mo-binding subunit